MLDSDFLSGFYRIGTEKHTFRGRSRKTHIDIEPIWTTRNHTTRTPTHLCL